MIHVEYEDLTEAQQNAVRAWLDRQDPNDFEYMDNQRYARKGVAEEEAGYDDRRAGGCCGFHDTEIQAADGTTILFGFNFGH